MANKTRKVAFNPDRLKYCQKLKNYTNKKLCDELFISLNTFNKNMMDKTIMPDALDLICKTLDVDPDYITGKSNDHVSDFDDSDFDSDYAEDLKRHGRIDSDGYIIGSYYEYIPTDTGDQQFKSFLLSLSGGGLIASEKELFSMSELSPAYIDSHFEGLKHAALIAISVYIDSHQK